MPICKWVVEMDNEVVVGFRAEEQTRESKSDRRIEGQTRDRMRCAGKFIEA